MNAPDADRMGAWRDEVAGVLVEWWASELDDDDEQEFVRTDPDSIEMARAYADALLPLLARVDREARGDGWDEGVAWALLHPWQREWDEDGRVISATTYGTDVGNPYRSEAKP